MAQTLENGIIYDLWRDWRSCIGQNSWKFILFSSIIIWSNKGKCNSKAHEGFHPLYSLKVYIEKWLNCYCHNFLILSQVLLSSQHQLEILMSLRRMGVAYCCVAWCGVAYFTIYSGLKGPTYAKIRGIVSFIAQWYSDITNGHVQRKAHDGVYPLWYGVAWRGVWW